MNDAVGFLELNSIARGVEAADILLKTADVSLVFAKASCPGKYYILFTGEVAAVRSSMEAGAAKGGENVVDTCVIPNIHPQVVKAVNMTAYPEVMEAVGVMEFYSVTASVYSADAAVKAADVELLLSSPQICFLKSQNTSISITARISIIRIMGTISELPFFPGTVPGMEGAAGFT